MCGVLGYYDSEGIPDKKKKKAIRRAFAELETRGTHASGLTGACDDKLWHYKGAITSSLLSTHLGYRNVVEKANCAILHSRFTTQGSERVNHNNHPFIETMGNGTLLSMVHNGQIKNYVKLKKRFKLTSDIETDSYIVLHLIKLFYDKYDDMDKAITHAVRWLEGSFTLLFVHVTGDNKPVMYMLRHDNPLEAIKYNSLLVVCSTSEIMRKGFKNFDEKYEIEEDRLYAIIGDGKIYERTKLKIYKPIVKKYVYPMTTTKYWDNKHDYNNGYNDYNETFELSERWCTDCQALRKGAVWVNKHQAMLCPACLIMREKETVDDGCKCHVCNTVGKKNIFRAILDMDVCDDCLIESLAETLTDKEIVELVTEKGAVIDDFRNFR
jgi:glucosamine 6-phosphate synthetase-like amidotransferase/phosphosugar isomerase protein